MTSKQIEYLILSAGLSADDEPIAGGIKDVFYLVNNGKVLRWVGRPILTDRWRVEGIELRQLYAIKANAEEEVNELNTDSND
jgi:hypothetical protein